MHTKKQKFPTSFVLFLALVSTLLILYGCGGSSTGPSPVPTPGPVTLTIVNGATGSPISGALVAIKGQSVVTNASGQAAFPSVLVGDDIDITAGGFLGPRQTKLTATTTLTLYPIEPSVAQALIYNEFVPFNKLTRPDPGTVYLRLSAEIANDPAALALHTQAATIVSAATSSKVTLVVSNTPPTGVNINDFLIDSTQLLPGQTGKKYNNGNKIAGAIISYREIKNARDLNLILHELGHTLGLGHISNGSYLMYPSSQIFGLTDFNGTEKLLLKMMFDRCQGTQFPDNDRNCVS